MKVLLVTSQFIDEKEDGYYCDSALIGTLQTMTELGELHVLSVQHAEGSSSIPMVCKIDFIAKGHVAFAYPTKRSIGGFLKNGRRNRAIIRELVPQMDLVVGYMPNDNGNYALKTAHRHGIPFLSFLVADTWYSLRYHQRLLVRLNAPYRWLTTRRAIRQSDYVHYVTREFLQRRYPTRGKALGCSDTNLRRMDDAILGKRKELAQTIGERKEIRLVTTGYVDVRYKGQEYVIRAMAELKRRGFTQYRYQLIGAGKGTYLRSLCRELGMENEVEFLGKKTRDEVMETLANADIYLQPSLTEALPRSVVEAMSMALPCIGFNAGGIPELLDSEFVVRQRDVEGIIACLLRLQDGDIYAQTAERNFHAAEDFEREKLVARITNFFREIRKEIESNNTSRTTKTQ